MYNPKAHLKRLVETHAPSGYEAPVADLLREDWAGLVDDFDSDRLGSLIGVKRGAGGGRAIMLAAHMDEIGLMVRESSPASSSCIASAALTRASCWRSMSLCMARAPCPA